MNFKAGLTLAALTIAPLGCSDDDPVVVALGDLEIVTVTTGDDLDADGYTVTVDGTPGPAIGPNASVTLPDLPTGSYEVGIDGVALNCVVGGNPRSVDVLGGATQKVQFDVTCEGPPANRPPVAAAGADISVLDSDGDGFALVKLDGSGSTDPDGTIISWVWDEGESQIATGETPNVTFAVGVHTVTLTVTDDQEAAARDEVIVTVEGAI